MDDLEFIARLVEALAWPVTAAVIALLLKSPLEQLLSSIHSLSYGELKAGFKQQIQGLAHDVASQHNEDANGVPQGRYVEKERYLMQLATVSPKAAIVEAWLEIEHAALEALSGIQGSDRSKLAFSPQRLGQTLFVAGKLDAERMKTFDRLRELRNQALHLKGLELLTLEVTEYIRLALGLAQHLHARATSPRH